MDDPLPLLDAAELRVLGALVEKQITTPDYYPLSLNALTNACNQLTNRDPVVSYEEQFVLRTLERLRDKRLATIFAGAESRVAKYKHTLNDRRLLTPAETALLAVLMLRGPQTIGELRTRSERLFAFDTLPETEETLNALAARQPQPLVARLPRQPGTKESRYAQLLSGPPAAASVEPSGSPAPPPPSSSAAPADDRLTRLEQELAELKREFAEFRKQFE
ncbi:MAG TPA: YceH family protein [Opitutus sp.]|nr:YceH family protein [Opitutus sp.]